MRDLFNPARLQAGWAGGTSVDWLRPATAESRLYRSLVLPLNAGFVAYILLVFFSVELFGAFSFVGPDTLGILFWISTVIAMALSAWLAYAQSGRNWRNYLPLFCFLGLVLAIWLYTELVRFPGPMNPDFLRYHGPRQLMQLINEDLSAFTASKPDLILIINYLDNFNMALFAATRTHHFAGYINIVSFLLILANTVWFLAETGRGRVAQAIACALLVAMPTMFGEVFLGKNNIFPVYLFTVSAVLSLRLVAGRPQAGALIPFAAFQGVLFAFILLVKVTVAIALLPYVAMIVFLVIRDFRPHWISIGMAAVSGAAVFGLLVAPYLLRQDMGPPDSAAARNLADWTANWVYLPPRPDCAVYVWPQHFYSVYDAVASLWGGGIDENITPEHCRFGRPNEDNWRLFSYNNGLPLLITFLGVIALPLALWRRMRLELCILAIGILALMVHQSVYANSIYNYRLVNLPFFLIAVGSAAVFGRLRPAIPGYGILAVAAIAAIAVVAGNYFEPRGVGRKYVEPDLVIDIETDENVVLQIEDVSRFEVYYLLRHLLERNDFAWSQIRAAYGGEVQPVYRLSDWDEIQATEFTHVAYCFEPNWVTDPAAMARKVPVAVDFNEVSCHVVRTGSPGR